MTRAAPASMHGHGGPTRSRGSVLAAVWGGMRPKLLLALPILGLGATIALAVTAIRLTWDNAAIRALAANHDVPAAPGAAPQVLLARIDFLVAHDRVDEVQPLVDALDRTAATPEMRAAAHYNFANGRLRQGFDLITAGKLDDAGPLVVLARQEYRQALTAAPEHWDAKFNLDVASRLIRDFPAFERTSGDTGKTDRKKIWTDLPGKPEGLP